MFVSFGYLSKKMIIPLLIPILYSVRHYLLEEFNIKLNSSEEVGHDTKEVKQQSVFLNTFIVSISYSLNFILFIIEYNKTKTGRKTKQQKEFDNQLIIEKLKKEKKQRKCRLLLLILIPLFNYIILLFYDILDIFKPQNYYKYYIYPLSIPFFFIITAFLSFLLLNYKIYCHQKLTMIISPILSLSLLIILVIKNWNEENITIDTNLFLVEILGLRSLRYVLAVLGKLFMEKMFVSHIKLMTYLGIFGIIFSLIANSLSFFINLKWVKNNPNLNDFFIIQDNKKRLKNIFDYWGNFDSLTCFIFIGIIILWFIEKHIIWFCIYTFSPNHYTIYASINSIIVLFFELIKLSNIRLPDIIIIIFSFIALCAIFICGLIFNEIIIVRLWELDKYTNVEIDKRQKEETKLSMVKYNDNNSNSNGEFPENSFDSDNLSDKIDRISSES